MNIRRMILSAALAAAYLLPAGMAAGAAAPRTAERLDGCRDVRFDNADVCEWQMVENK